MRASPGESGAQGDPERRRRRRRLFARAQAACQGRRVPAEPASPLPSRAAAGPPPTRPAPGARRPSPTPGDAPRTTAPALTLPLGLALSWDPTLRSRPTSPHLPLSDGRRKLWESKWEQTVKGRPNVRSRYSPSHISAFVTRTAHPTPHLCSHQPASHHASHIYPMHIQDILAAPGPPPVTSLLHL